MERDGRKPGLEIVRRAPRTPDTARHPFRMLDQVNALVDVRDADADLGFMARLLMLCSLPRTNPRNRLQYVRRNGPFTLVLTATGEYKLPYGTLPRLLLAWVCTEAVKTQSRELVLGHSLSEFMRELGVDDASGRTYTRLRNQMNRLFHSSVEFTHQHEHGEQFVASRVVDRGEFWWDPKRPEEPVLWQSKIELGEKFFQEIIAHPVPLDMNILKELTRSPLGLDLYMWLTYRTFRLDAPKRLTWPTLYRQFGVEPKRASDKFTVRDFRKDCLRELVKIKTAWPDLNYRVERGARWEKSGALILLPSTPVIPPSSLRPGRLSSTATTTSKFI